MRVISLCDLYSGEVPCEADSRGRVMHDGKSGAADGAVSVLLNFQLQSDLVHHFHLPLAWHVEL